MQVKKVTILDRTDEIVSAEYERWRRMQNALNINKFILMNTLQFGCHFMSIEFQEGQSPVEGKTKYISCFATDDLLQGLIRVHHGDERLKISTRCRGRGGRGRGKGSARGERGLDTRGGRR
jgi:hypothetical protein